MFDPLGSSPFAEDNVLSPPWPTTPHPPNSPIPNLKRASSHRDLTSSSQPHTPEKTPVSPVGSTGTGPFGREPQIYGQPENGLISPASHTGANGAKYEKTEPYLRTRITMLDRNRRDILVRFDAQVCVYSFQKLLCLLPTLHVLLDEPAKLYWLDLPQYFTLLCRIPAIL